MSSTSTSGRRLLSWLQYRSSPDTYTSRRAIAVFLARITLIYAALFLPWYYSDPVIGRAYAFISGIYVDALEFDNVDSKLSWENGMIKIYRHAEGKRPLSFSTGSRVEHHSILLFVALLFAAWRGSFRKAFLFAAIGVAVLLALSPLMFATMCLYPFSTMQQGPPPESALYYFGLFGTKSRWLFARLAAFHVGVGRELYAVVLCLIIGVTAKEIKAS